jgi:hypothetical protein
MYTIGIANSVWETSAEIRARLNQADEIEARHIKAIDRIEREGIKYSNEDFDILSGARYAVWRRGECERLGLPTNCGPNEFWGAKARGTA